MPELRRRPDPARLVPTDPAAALEVRTMDRIFDNDVSTPQQKLVFDAIRPERDSDAYGVAEARTLLDTTYSWLDGALSGRTWATGETVSLADGAAAPALVYADWSQPIARAFASLRAYRRLFPLGAPDRDWASGPRGRPAQRFRLWISSICSSWISASRCHCLAMRWSILSCR